ncbi:MAG TPA: hypothetical protein PLI52_00185 [Prochlorococcaceae cyanobacterium AMR_MDS_5431]|nr:hypothetical protein [Prochlorococcaceae cyanobacterium AMR_MDS_5431]
MTDQSNLESNPVSNERRSNGGRGAGNREPGGFRIRLSDNEMKAARSVQEAFGLRSTVAALGFAIRTIGYMLEQGKLDELVAQQRSQTQRNERAPEQVIRHNANRNRVERGHRPDPFARPSKPISDTSGNNTEISELITKQDAIPES